MLEKKVSIVGAGIAGMIVGKLLAEKGFRVSIHERAGSIAASGGFQIWPNGTRVLASIGALDEALSHGDAMRQVRWRQADGRELLTYEVQQFTTPAIAIRRQHLLQAIYRTLPEGLVRFDSKCMELRMEDRSPVLAFEDGRAEEADIVIGADGFDSPVRRYLQGNDNLHFGGFRFWSCAIEADTQGIEPGVLYETSAPGRRGGYYRLGEGRINWYASQRADRRGVSISKADFVAPFARWRSRLHDLMEQTPDEAIAKREMCDRDPAAPWFDDNAIVIGDAAHPTFPQASQGAAMAMEDAVTLAHFLAASRTADDAFRHFRAFRLDRVANAVHSARRIARMANLPSPFFQLYSRLFPYLAPKVYGRLQQTFHGYDVFSALEETVEP